MSANATAASANVIAKAAWEQSSMPETVAGSPLTSSTSSSATHELHPMLQPGIHITTAKECLSMTDLPVTVHLRGTAKFVRKQGRFVFIDFYDGSTCKPLQLIGTKKTFTDIPLIGSGLFVTGELKASPGAGQHAEVKIISYKSFEYDSSSPMAAATPSMQFLRGIPHLRLKNRSLAAIMRIRHVLTQATHRFFDATGFMYMRTPIITGSDCEGAGEAFIVSSSIDTADKKFFGQDVSLVVSGQLYGESGAQAMQKIYTFGPTFRAEQSHTSRHMSEFDMIEPEMVAADLSEIVRNAYEYVVFCIKTVLAECRDDLVFLQNSLEDNHDLIAKLTKCLEATVVTYTEAIAIVSDAIDNDKLDAEQKIAWGDDMNSIQEKYLVAHFGVPVFVIQYPKAIKSFYMLETPNCDDGFQTVECVDFLVPGIGELVGGSMRTSRYAKIIADMEAKNMNIAEYQWYADLRRFGGLPTGGYGVGLERLIMLVTGVKNIRDVIPMPRAPGDFSI